MTTRLRMRAVAMVALCVVLVACSTGGESGGAAEEGAASPAATQVPTATEPAPEATATAATGSEDLTRTVGPSGQEATPTAELTLSDEEVQQLQEGDYSAAMVWHTSSDFVNAVQAGATDTFNELGIEVVATTDAGFDSAQQANDVATIMAQDPDILLTLPVDPPSGRQVYGPALEADTQIVLLSNVPEDFEQGEDYVTVVTDDLFQMGKLAADRLAESIDGEGEVGWIFHDADYYVTNQRDNAFKTTIENDYPNISIAAEAGIADPARAEEIASAMLTQNPNLDGVYVTWAEPAEGVLAALRTAGNTSTNLVTLDLSEPVALDMVQGGNTVGIVADEAYELGRALATAGAYGLLDKPAPPFLVAPALIVTADNIVEGWNRSLHRDPPDVVMDALQ